MNTILTLVGSARDLAAYMRPSNVRHEVERIMSEDGVGAMAASVAAAEYPDALLDFGSIHGESWAAGDIVGALAEMLDGPALALSIWLTYRRAVRHGVRPSEWSPAGSELPVREAMDRRAAARLRARMRRRPGLSGRAVGPFGMAMSQPDEPESEPEATE